MNLYNTLELFYILNKGKHINLLSNIYKMFKLKLVVEADNTFNLATLKNSEILCFLARWQWLVSARAVYLEVSMFQSDGDLQKTCVEPGHQ